MSSKPSPENVNASSNDNFNTSAAQKTQQILVNNIKAGGGKYSGNPKNDYCLHFVSSGERPQNYIRDYEEDRRFIGYPKLNELIKLKNDILQKRATPAMWIQCDLKTFDLSKLGKFDVILIDPPLPEYYHRAKSFGIETEEFTPWTFEEIQKLQIEQLADNCCFIFLWVGNEEGLDKGRQLFQSWKFRRCEDIVWVKTNRLSYARKTNFENDNNLLQHTKEHCLVGIKGAVKRGTDGHFIHANIDTDVIVGEEPPQGSTEKPEELYRIIERFCMGRKRIELFGEDRNKRGGWLTLGKSLSNTNFNKEKYDSFFKGELCYPDVQGYEGGRYVGCTKEIEELRPRSPAKNNNTQDNMYNLMVNNNNNLLNNMLAQMRLRNFGMNIGTVNNNANNEEQ